MTLFRIVAAVSAAVGLLAIATSCSDEPLPALRRAGELACLKDENAARQAIGLRIVQEQWVLYRAEMDFEDFKVGASDSYLVKRVMRRGGKVIGEQDYFYSGRTFSDREGTTWEHVTTDYDYASRKMRVWYIGGDQHLSILLAGYDEPSTNVHEVISNINEIVQRW